MMGENVITDLAINSKDGGEESIEDFQGEGDCAGLVIMLNGHGHHIEEDQDEDGNFKSVGKDNIQ